MGIYFDNAATTRPYDEVIELYASEMRANYANASSVHSMGVDALAGVTAAQRAILQAAGLEDTHELVFTSGATESANTAIRGVFANEAAVRRSSVVSSGIEHACVSSVLKDLAEKGARLIPVPVDANGVMSPQSVEEAVCDDTRLVCIIQVQNEFGVVQPVGDQIKAVRRANRKTLVHVDAVQGFTKVDGQLRDADLISLSAHKFHGPKGVGALMVKKGVRLTPLLLGGGQQNNQRSGTINSPAITAAGLAATMASDPARREACRELQRHLVTGLTAFFGPESLNTPFGKAECAPHIINISLNGVKGEVIVHMLEHEGIFISSGSACSSYSGHDASPLFALGRSKSRVESSVRISLWEGNTVQEADTFLDRLIAAVIRVRSLGGGMR